LYEYTKAFRFKQALFIVYTAVFHDLVLGCCICVITYLRRRHVSQVYRFCISSLIQSLCRGEKNTLKLSIGVSSSNECRQMKGSQQYGRSHVQWHSIWTKTNKVVRQRCVLSPVLFNVDISKILQEFKMVINKGIHLINRKIINTMLYADDQMLLASSEDELKTMS